MRSCPSKLSLRRQRRVRSLSCLVGSTSRSDHRWSSLHRRALPSHPFSPRGGKMVSHPTVQGLPCATWSRGPRALLHRRVRCVSDRFQSAALGAPVGLPILLGVPSHVPCGTRRGTVRSPPSRGAAVRSSRARLPPFGLGSATALSVQNQDSYVKDRSEKRALGSTSLWACQPVESDACLFAPHRRL